MAEFQFLQNPISKKWIILAPRRARRPNVATGAEPVCPFCLGREKDEQEVYRIGGVSPEANWKVRVLPNKYPFAPIHELIIHSPDHHQNFESLPLYQIELIFKTYRQRYLAHQNKGQVFIFHNRGEGGGESLPHPHTQLVVIPEEVKTDLPRLDPYASVNTSPKPASIGAQVKGQETILTVETNHFYLFCPHTSQWPDEVWVSPQKRGRLFGEITDGEIADLTYIIKRLIQIMNLRHGNEFSYNFYIYPGGDWYLRLIPRVKSLGGFEIGTGIFVNTQKPEDTIAFIKEHFESPNFEKIKTLHRAEYGKGV